ncbi:MAG: hypothetical protein R6X27_18635 [Candidatus Desulfacyla sp.]
MPIEVKAGKSGALKRLHQFAARKESTLCVRFDLNPPGIRSLTHSAKMVTDSVPVSFVRLSLPLYLVEALPGILEAFRGGSSALHM